tara:strand:+ start:173 stop:466 length:294 start_codon:yes stop_codon:yes gene_type:complete
MKKRKNNFKPLLVTIFICLIWIVFNESGLIKWAQLRYQEEILTQELHNIQLEKENLIQHIDILENDINYIEFLAYSKYKMVKPGEKIFRIKNTKKIK